MIPLMNENRVSPVGLLTVAGVAIVMGSFAFASQAGKEFNDSEKALNEAYQKVLAIVTDPEEKRLLAEAQKSWIKFRDAHRAFHGRYFPSSKGGLFEATDMTQERTKYLEMLLTDEAKAEHRAP